MIGLEFVLDALLCGAVILLALLSLFVRHVFTAIVFYISVGLIASIIWARLDAWDVAIAELAIGTGLTGALFIMAWHKLCQAQRVPQDAQE